LPGTHPPGRSSYFFDSREQTRQDACLTEKSIRKRLNPAYTSSTTKMAPDRYAPGPGLYGVFPQAAALVPAQSDVMIKKRKKRTAMDMTMTAVQVMITQNGRSAVSGIPVF
jgi:hypothetical protein